MAYRLLMLGPPALTRDTEAVTLKSHKGQALLWYLAADPTRSFPREHLYGLLWDELPTDQARRSFNTMLSRFKTELPVDSVHGSQGQLGWNTHAGITTDLEDFLHWTASLESESAQDDPGASLTHEEKDVYHRAIALWRGPFLDGFTCDSASYEEWMITERRQWEIRMIDVLAVLIQAEKSDGLWDRVLSLARRGLDIDPLQEPFHRAVMEALFHQGNRSAALAQFASCRALFDEQLQSQPDAATIALAEAIKGASTSPKDPLVVSGTGAMRPQAEHGRDADVDSGEETPPARITPDHAGDLTASMPPLIGRSREYTQVTEALRTTARRHHCQAVLLHGEAGIGKTRLMAEIVDAVAKETWAEMDFPTLLLGRAHDWMEGVPYGVFAGALAPVLTAAGDPSALLPDVWLRELGRLLPDVFIHRPDLTAPQPMESGDDRLRLFQAVARFLSALPQPVLLALDDVQWADPLSIALLDYLIRHPGENLTLAALITVRDGDDPDALRFALNTLDREDRLTRVPLGHLTKDDTLALVASLFPQDDPEQAARVFSHSQGHPLHTVELVSMLLESEERTDASGPLPVPPTVQEVFVGRLARLGDEAGQVADALAVFGRAASLDQLRRATELPEGPIVKAVQGLSRAYIIMEDKKGRISFRHDVFRQVVLARLSRTALIHLHRQAYAALAEQLPFDIEEEKEPAGGSVNQQLLADLIAHSISGQLWAIALRWTRRAADTAQRLYAFAAAVDYLHASLLCLEHLPDSDDYRLQRLDIELHVAKLDRWLPPDVRDGRLAALVATAREYNAQSRLPLIHMAQAESLILQGRCTEARQLLSRLAPLSARDPRIALGLNAWQGAIDAVVGDVHSALTHLGQVLQVMGERVLQPGTSVYAGMAACYAAAGQFDRADASLAAVEKEEKEQGYQTLTSKFLTVAATVEYLRGDWNKAAAYARAGLHTSRDAEDPANEALSALWLGAATLELATGPSSGDPRSGRQILHEAVEALEAALAASKRAQSYTRRDFIYAFLAAAYELSGRSDKAQKTVAAGLSLVDRFGYREGAALITESQGRMAAFRGDPDDARHHLNHAINQFDALGNIAGVRRCRRRLGSDNAMRDLAR